MISIYFNGKGPSSEGRRVFRPLQAVQELFSINLALKREFNPDLMPEPVALSESLSAHVGHSDLMQMVTEVLLEHERLAHLTAQLMEAKPSDSEMEGLMRRFLPFLDSLERLLFLARDFPPSDEIANWLTGVESIYFRLINTLEKYGLTAIDTVGKPVDLDAQEVVEYVTTADHKHNHVIKERQKGYKYHAKLMRDAKVVVANNPQRS